MDHCKWGVELLYIDILWIIEVANIAMRHHTANITVGYI